MPDFVREPFRGLRTHLQLSMLDKPPSHLAITSAIAGEGKSTITRNLALTYRESGLSVLVVEADLRSPTLSELFGVKRRDIGLTSVLTGEAHLDDALIDVAFDSASLDYLDKLRAGVSASAGATAVSAVRAPWGLSFLPSGPQPPNPQVVLAADRTQQLVAHLTQRFDVVLIDTPPVLAVSDALPLLAQADGVIIVSRVGLTERPAAARLMTTLGLDPRTHVLGAVANDMPREVGSGYGYGYGYGKYGHSNGSQGSRA